MSWDRPTEQLLSYVEQLSTACVERNVHEIDKLLRLRLSTHLPRTVLDEAEFFRRAGRDTLRAPLKLLRHLHKLRHLAVAQPQRAQLRLELPDATRSVLPATGAGRRRAARRR